jgi:Zn-dependent protease
VLYALGHPATFAVLLASFVLGITLHHWVQALVAARMGDHRPRLERRHEFNPQRHVDPFGAVAALISGLGWGRQVELPTRSRAATWTVALAGPLANIVLGVGLLLTWRFALSDGPATGLAGLYGAVGAADVLKDGPFGLGTDGLAVATLLVGASQLYLGVLSLVPLPPLDGGRLMLALAPHTLGWQRARHYLVEQNVGTIALLVLLILPLGGDLLLPQLLDTLLAPLMSAILGV